MPITWSKEDGLDTVIKGNGTWTLNWISKLHGISVDHLESITGLIHIITLFVHHNTYTLFITGYKRDVSIPKGHVIRFNKPKRWLTIAKWFGEWENWIRGLPNLNRTQQNRLFITHQLNTDLQRTCHSMYDLMHEYVNGNVNRKWVPKRFSQDILESFFSEIRQSGGGNTDSCRAHVNSGVRRKRFQIIEKIMRMHAKC